MFVLYSFDEDREEIKLVKCSKNKESLYAIQKTIEDEQKEFWKNWTEYNKKYINELKNQEQQVYDFLMRNIDCIKEYNKKREPWRDGPSWDYDDRDWYTPNGKPYHPDVIEQKRIENIKHVSHMFTHYFDGTKQPILKDYIDFDKLKEPILNVVKKEIPQPTGNCETGTYFIDEAEEI